MLCACHIILCHCTLNMRPNRYPQTVMAAWQSDCVHAFPFYSLRLLLGVAVIETLLLLTLKCRVLHVDAGLQMQALMWSVKVPPSI